MKMKNIAHLYTYNKINMQNRTMKKLTQKINKKIEKK